MTGVTVEAGELERRFGGEIIRPGDPSYEDARKVWNGSIDRHPGLIVRPVDEPDVVAAVMFARDRDLRVAVRGGAHSVAGHSTCDGGLVIDLSGMKGIRIDPERRRAHVQPGVLWGELDRETQAFGLAVTGGLISSTGVAGFTLGGGIGWLQRKLGLACDNLVSAEVITATGASIRASDGEDADLLWALRGGGGNFGIVTSFEFELHPVGPEVMAGLMLFPGDSGPEVLAFFRDYHAEAPTDLTLGAVLRQAPPAPFVPEEAHGKPVIGIAGVHGGSIDKAQDDLRPLKELAAPIADLMVPRPYTQMQALMDASWAPGFQNYWKADYLTGLPDSAIEILTGYLETITSPLSDFKIPYLGGAIAAVGEDESAYGFRDAPFIVNINARWSEPRESDRHMEWTRSLWDALQPFSAGGTYTNFMSEDEADRVPDSYGSAKYLRLSELKKRYDPDNFFRLNQNIRP